MKTYLITNLRKQSNYEEDKINFEAVFNNELGFVFHVNSLCCLSQVLVQVNPDPSHTAIR